MIWVGSIPSFAQVPPLPAPLRGSVAGSRCLQFRACALPGSPARQVPGTRNEQVRSSILLLGSDRRAEDVTVVIDGQTFTGPTNNALVKIGNYWAC